LISGLGQEPLSRMLADHVRYSQQQQTNPEGR